MRAENDQIGSAFPSLFEHGIHAGCLQLLDGGTDSELDQGVTDFQELGMVALDGFLRRSLHDDGRSKPDVENHGLLPYHMQNDDLAVEGAGQQGACLSTLKVRSERSTRATMVFMGCVFWGLMG
jgi:hypothetical protein